MTDPGEEPNGLLLSSFLKDCRELVLPPFQDAERNARKFQHHYLWSAGIGAVSGTFAVWLAIFQLYAHDANSAPRWTLFTWLELLSVGITFLSVIVGMWASWKKRWLEERFRAENLRLLKFRSLIDPERWNAGKTHSEKAKHALSDKVSEAATTTFPSLPRWLKERARPEVREPLADGSITEERRELLDYYWRQRLDFQRTYLIGHARKFRNWDRMTWLLGSVLFFGSLAVVLAHVVVENFKHLPALVLIAALLPVFGAGVRTYRAGTETARNAGRCEATHQNLCELSDGLRNATDANAQLRVLDCCEQVLEADVHEWMRLMTELEWFG
jgi:hypothetical protein